MARKRGGGEYIHHVTGVRMRVTGAGSLKMSLHGLNDILNRDLVPFTLSATDRKEKFRLSNFQSQRIRFTGQVTELNEQFLIRRIVIFTRTIATDYPA